MTQPPQPPNEPPQGGFGAPQNPPSGGFGAPPPQNPAGGQPSFDKPRDPGYGYPQTPPPPGQAPATPPPPPPGQAPQTPPPPGTPPPGGQPTYGYPQAPGAPAGGRPPTAPGAPQQGYGYPGQQQYGSYQQPSTMPMQPQAAGGGKKLNAQMVIIISAVVAIALIVGGGVWYSHSSGSSDSGKDQASSGGKDGKDGKGGKGGDDKGTGAGKEKVPADTSAKVLFQLPAPKVPKDDVWSVAGSWLTDKVYAKSGVSKVVGYDAATGKETWTLPLDGMTCAASPEVADDGTAVVIAEAAKRAKKDDYQPCDKVTAFNMNTGEELWTKEAKVGDQEGRYEEASITGDTVAIGGGTDGGAAFDLKTGKSLWTPKPGACQDEGYRGGEQLVAVRKCGDYGDESFEVQLLNPADGKPKWTYKLPKGIDNAKVISSKPVVFGVDSGEITASGVTDVFSLDDAGKLRTKITLADGKYEHDCGVNKVHDCHGITVGNDRLYVPTKEHQGGGEYGMTNEIVSFSLATGKSTGDKFDAGDKYTMFPIRMDGGNILAYKDGPYDKGAQVVTIAPKANKQTKLLETPASKSVLDALSGMVPKTSEMLYGNGKLFLGKDLISPPYSEDQKRYTALGFGTQ